MDLKRVIAYFSMEIAVDTGMPTYAGGLGVLAGDTVRSAADMKVPMAAVTLLHREGYFYQRIDTSGWQTEEPVSWVVEDYLVEEEPRVTVSIEGKEVHLRAWRYDVLGESGGRVPVYMLDANLEENEEWHRGLTNRLYGGDGYYRICQEVILGIGGVRMLRALGHNDLRRFHMNEGHSSLLTLELLDEVKKHDGPRPLTDVDIDIVRQLCIFTTHTPVAAGHDKFPIDLATRVIGFTDDVLAFKNLIFHKDMLNMTYLALNLSRYVNGVARRHGQISQTMFAEYEIDAITNGVHAATWVSKPFQVLFDKYVSGWRLDNFSLRYTLSIPPDEIWEAHREAKRELIQAVNSRTNAGLDDDDLTFGFARRAAPYKRGALPLSDIERLAAIAQRAGKVQFIYAGKAHPGDDVGKGIIQRIHEAKDALHNRVRIAYVANYDMELAKLLTSGVDVWLNTPQPPLEASGTSGMKAALNGVPSFSVLDGWWVEGYIEGHTGWRIGRDHELGDGRDRWDADAASFYDILETELIPAYYADRGRFVEMMQCCIALNGSYFNTQRMLQQYVLKAYFL